jgi:hypothetical protein
MANGDAQGSAGPTNDPPGPHEPADQGSNSSGARLPHRQAIYLGIYFLCLSALTFYVLIATWPVVESGNKFNKPHVFGLELTASGDARLLIMVVAAGALGSLVHCLTSFADYVGNRKLNKSWVWYFILRTPIGISLALVFYLVLRGGLVAPTGGQNAQGGMLLNPYGLAAIAAMAGMFSKQATDKLSEVFDTLFQVNQPVDRADPLDQAQPVISSVEPAALTVGRATELAVIGQRFDKDCKALINGEVRDASWKSATRLTTQLLQKDVLAEGELRVAVRNPSSAGGDSKGFPVPVRPAA